jgi:predicted glycogen debranching enzyme
MRATWDHTECQNLKNALSREWLETNGLGGYASSTIIGANTRRHHGLLVAALEPPGARHVLLSKLEERVVEDGHEAHLSTNLYPGTVFPHGFNIQNEFRLRPWPTFRYAGAGFEIEKSVCLVYGENTLVAAYRNRNRTGTLSLAVRPLLAFRDFNKLAKRNPGTNVSVERRDHVLSVQPYAQLPRLFFHFSPCDTDIKADWYLRFTYPTDQERGLEYEEDLFSPFELTFRLSGNETVYVTATTEPHDAVNAAELLERERQRRQQFNDRDPVRAALRAAADAFIVRRGKDGLTLLSGYPWYGDSARGAMVALPGLTLTTERFDEAKCVLSTFAKSCERGLLPNVFGEKPAYNSVDAPLWFAVAAWKYWKASNDAGSMRDLLPALRDIARCYQEGTRFDIYADADGLISAGGPGSQLTWMDVKLDGYVPTPRHGKAVEINALWFNALLMLAEIEEKIADDVRAAGLLRKFADRVATSFVKTFWYADGGYLYDVVQGDNRDASVRPNQIFAVSLPYSPLSAEQQQSVLRVVTEQLLTPYGLRTLSPRHEKYARRYTGTRWQRDAIRHQGTVWPYLIGAYADAFLRVRSDGKEQHRELLQHLQPLLKHLEDAGVGSISEMFDADSPHYPAGCPFRACSVSELLRAYDLCRK